MSFEPNTQFLEKVADFIDDVDGMGFIPRHATQLLDNQEYEELDKFMGDVRREQEKLEHSGFGLGDADVY